jgi:hypothetical protein
MGLILDGYGIVFRIKTSLIFRKISGEAALGASKTRSAKLSARISSGWMM